MAESAPPPLRVMTWNVHGCIGSDGAREPGRTLAVIRRLDPDIAALQEVDARDRGDGTFDAFSYFREHSGSHAVEARTVAVGDGHYGHMVVSRWPLEDARTYDVSCDGREPRMVIETYANLPDGYLRVIAAHLGVRARERRSQVAALRTIVERDLETPAVLLGDFNQSRRRSAIHRVVAPHFGSPGAPATFPARLPLLPLDRIWCRPHGMVERLWADADARPASDHLPLVADLRP